MHTTVCSSCVPLNSNTNTSSHSQPRTPSLASWPLRMRFVRTARSKHKTPPRTLGRDTLGREASRRSHFICSSCVPLNQSKHKIKNLLALSTEDGGPYVVATWYYVVSIVCSSCVPLHSNTNTFSHSPRRTGGPQAPASGALVYYTVDPLLLPSGNPFKCHEEALYICSL